LANEMGVVNSNYGELVTIIPVNAIRFSIVVFIENTIL